MSYGKNYLSKDYLRTTPLEPRTTLWKQKCLKTIIRGAKKGPAQPLMLEILAFR